MTLTTNSSQISSSISKVGRNLQARRKRFSGVLSLPASKPTWESGVSEHRRPELSASHKILWPRPIIRYTSCHSLDENGSERFRKETGQCLHVLAQAKPFVLVFGRFLVNGRLKRDDFKMLFPKPFHVSHFSERDFVEHAQESGGALRTQT